MANLNKFGLSGSAGLFSERGSARLFGVGGSIGQHNPVARSLNINRPPVREYGVSVTNAPSTVQTGETVSVSADVSNEVDLQQTITVELFVDSL